MGACDIWNVLHDATVIAIAGKSQHTIQLELECDYLRDRISDPGTRFFLTLENCTRFTYRPWSDDATEIDDLTVLAARRLWIKSADWADGSCAVNCSENIRGGVGGKLEISAQKTTLTVDNGREVSFTEIEEVAEEYWSGFHARKNHE